MRFRKGLASFAVAGAMTALCTGWAGAQEFTCYDNAAKSMTAKIVGGTRVRGDNYPWIVNLDIGNDGYKNCGGTLVAPDLVVTAAHCVNRDPSASNYTVRRTQDNGFWKGETSSVREVVVHPDYDPERSTNDIALLKLSTSMSVAPARLPRLLSDANKDYWAKPGHCAQVIGWGTTSSGGSATEYLESVYVPIWKNLECNAAIGDINRAMMCAGYVGGGYDSCQGDSGGPLIIEGGATGTILAGVVSWGYGCAEPNQPGVYARVSEFEAWIRANY